MRKLWRLWLTVLLGLALLLVVIRMVVVLLQLLLVAARPTVGTTNQRQTATTDFLDGLLRVGFLARLGN